MKNWRFLLTPVTIQDVDIVVVWKTNGNMMYLTRTPDDFTWTLKVISSTLHANMSKNANTKSPKKLQRKVVVSKPLFLLSCSNLETVQSFAVK